VSGSVLAECSVFGTLDGEQLWQLPFVPLANLLRNQ
jgi:hypothetical protein